ncbi:MAG: tetratricopeptide repeat protein [Bacteroidota bacterium]
MKNFFAGILIYLFAFNLAIAMDSYEGPTIDSLQKLLNNTLSEEDRFSVLNQLSRAYHPLEPTVARTYNNQAKALIETFDNPAYPKAITDLQEGRILIAERNMQSAIEVIQKAQNTALELDDQRLIAQCIQEIGYAHMLLSNYEQSEKLINQSLLLGRQLNDDRIIAENKSNLARIFDVQGDFNKALLNNFEALDIYKAIKDDYQITRSYNNIAIIYQHQGDYDKALEYYNRALEAAQKSNLIKLASYMYHNIGTIYVLRQEYSKAIDLYLNAADDFRRYKDTISLGQAYENIGDILVDIKQFEQSEQYFKQAEQLYSLKDDSLSIADVYLNLGNLYKEQNNGEKAMVFNDKALNLFLKYNAKPSVAIAQTQQAYCYLNEGQIDKARSYFNRSLTIAKEVSDSARIAENFLGISSILLKQKPIPDEVFDLSFQAYGWAVRADAVLAQKKALENLSVAYEEKGEYDKAFQYFKEFKAISDKLLNEENVQRITGAKQELELQAQQESERILRNQVKLRTTIQNVLAILLINNSSQTNN